MEMTPSAIRLDFHHRFEAAIFAEYRHVGTVDFCHEAASFLHDLGESIFGVGVTSGPERLAVAFDILLNAVRETHGIIVRRFAPTAYSVTANKCRTSEALMCHGTLHRRPPQKVPPSRKSFP